MRVCVPVAHVKMKLTISKTCRRPLFKHACVIVCMRVCVPVAHVKMKLTISKTYKLVLLHVAACCVCITVSNFIIKQHNLTKTMNSCCGSCKIKTDHFEKKTYRHVLFDKKQEYKSFARELEWNTQLLGMEELAYSWNTSWKTTLRVNSAPCRPSGFGWMRTLTLC